MARVVAADYAHAGIRVNTAVPGYTETPLVQKIADDPVSRAGLVNSTLLGRPGTAADVEGILVFLASDDSTYATGGIFTVRCRFRASVVGHAGEATPAVTKRPVPSCLVSLGYFHPHRLFADNGDSVKLGEWGQGRGLFVLPAQT